MKYLAFVLVAVTATQARGQDKPLELSTQRPAKASVYEVAVGSVKFTLPGEPKEDTEVHVYTEAVGTQVESGDGEPDVVCRLVLKPDDGVFTAASPLDARMGSGEACDGPSIELGATWIVRTADPQRYFRLKFETPEAATAPLVSFRTSKEGCEPMHLAIPSLPSYVEAGQRLLFEHPARGWCVGRITDERQFPEDCWELVRLELAGDKPEDVRVYLEAEAGFQTVRVDLEVDPGAPMLSALACRCRAEAAALGGATHIRVPPLYRCHRPGPNPAHRRGHRGQGPRRPLRAHVREPSAEDHRLSLARPYGFDRLRGPRGAHQYHA